ncbi:50S ribosomal protein L29 [Ruficoccus sp. ZRK36]|uniref:50S ribosomal protein L29 n=1 Tax=Ruficoccus sp. ZRK36 TaxID=2866311 RepID=UPI001C72B2C0|nr:50S ribosomal protein L29 [Ruficoccus sp. ZRK36]QYY35857.1 50S ribosomal protein L29 [Ruficoccus sp. ZRK36]
MKAAEIRELSTEEIKKKLRDTRNELVQLRVRKQAGQVEKSSELRELRRDIARLETTLRAKSGATA